MAIFSLNHSFIGRSTHTPGTAGAWVRYITRNEACTTILGRNMPLDRSVYAWLDHEEKSDRRNARVIDRVIVALPAELTREQNVELLESFGERLTKDRAAFLAAIHDGPGDADNPHAHIAFRDRDVETGRRVMMTTEAGSTERFRQAWEEEVNRALERAGLEIRVDRRSLADQGIDREPQLHVGPGAQRLAERDHEFRSNEKQVTRLVHGEPTEVTVNYPAIDQGRTRFEENELRKLRNWTRAQEAMAVDGPARPGEMPPMDHVAYRSFLLDARYRAAAGSGNMPADDGDPITAVIREHMAERGQGDHPRTHGTPRMGDQPPLPSHDPYQNFMPDRAGWDDQELKLRKEEFEKLKSEPGMGEVLRARAFLNALAWEQREAAPTDQELLAYLIWQRENRLPVPRENEGYERGKPRKPGPLHERGPRKDAGDLLVGGGLAVIGRVADSLETLLDTRSGREIERDEGIMAEKRSIEQLTENQQRQQEAEAQKWRQQELEAYLAQRDRERHIDRGR